MIIRLEGLDQPCLRSLILPERRSGKWTNLQIGQILRKIRHQSQRFSHKFFSFSSHFLIIMKAERAYKSWEWEFHKKQDDKDGHRDPPAVFDKFHTKSPIQHFRNLIRFFCRGNWEWKYIICWFPAHTIFNEVWSLTQRFLQLHFVVNVVWQSSFKTLRALTLAFENLNRTSSLTRFKISFCHFRALSACRGPFEENQYSTEV